MSDSVELVCQHCGSRQLNPDRSCGACGELRADELPDAGDTRKVKQAEAKAKRQQREDDNITRSLMATAPGRVWMWKRLERCHIMHTSFSTDPLVMALKEGERNIGLSLVADVMRACPDLYVLMSNEASTR